MFRRILWNIRCFADEKTKKPSEGDASSTVSKGSQGWISRMLTGPATYSVDDAKKQSHSTLLSDSQFVYEFSTHDAKCGHVDEYLNHYENYVGEMSHAVPGAQLVGSWTVAYGRRDQAVHLWRYKNGYEDIDRAIDAVRQKKPLWTADQEYARLTTRRRTVIIKAFSYWGDPIPRTEPHIYDMRSYVLKPGSMIEWGNAWAKGITFRRDYQQDVGGFFSQVGQLYMVFHLWAYKSLVERKGIRENTWSKPGWDSTVEYTVPLIQRMRSQILIPTKLSKLQ